MLEECLQCKMMKKEESEFFLEETKENLSKHPSNEYV